MCGRFTQIFSWDDLVRRMELVVPASPITKRYNIAPTQEVAVVRAAEEGGAEGTLLRWGLIPFWAKDEGIGSKLINARAETVDSKPSFRAALKSRRCLIPASGFYEWTAAQDGKKQPYYITPVEGLLFFAGLWERWEPADGQTIETCTIITTQASSRISSLHSRMPVMLNEEARSAWLHAEQKPSELRALFDPHSSEQLQIYPVSRIVNNPNNDTESCVAALP